MTRPLAQVNLAGTSYNSVMIIELLFLVSCGTALAPTVPSDKPEGAKVEKKAPRKEAPPCNPFPPLAQ